VSQSSRGPRGIDFDEEISGPFKDELQKARVKSILWDLRRPQRVDITLFILLVFIVLALLSSVAFTVWFAVNGDTVAVGLGFPIPVAVGPGLPIPALAYCVGRIAKHFVL